MDTNIFSDKIMIDHIYLKCEYKYMKISFHTINTDLCYYIKQPTERKK